MRIWTMQVITLMIYAFGPLMLTGLLLLVVRITNSFLIKPSRRI